MNEAVSSFAFARERVARYLVALYCLLLIYVSFSTPLLPSEAKLLYAPEAHTIAQWLARWGSAWIPGVPGVRLGFLLMGFVALWLYRNLLESEFSSLDDRRFAWWIFALLPGVIASLTLATEAGPALLLTLLFLYARRRKSLGMQIAALLLLEATYTAAFALYLVLSIYFLVRRERIMASVSLLLLIVALIWGNYDFHNKPQGHLVELLGIYAAAFSPLLFIYYFYALYRLLLQGPRNLDWAVAFGTLLISMLLSIRQKILITDFIPFLLPGIFLAVRVYFGSLRIRMRRFRRPYILAGAAVLTVLILSSAILIFHRPLYRFLGEPAWFFSAPIYHHYDRIRQLRSKHSSCFDPARVSHRYHDVMRFYGLHPCRE